MPGPGEFLEEVSLHDVLLGLDSMHWRAQQMNMEYLLKLDVDSLVWSFRKTASLPMPGNHMGAGRIQLVSSGVIL